ncbi:MAG: hypothetical protein WC335_08345, partial [Candidatus Omnitrophota bacterium]
MLEAISEIREEAEHSPAVAALFGGEDYDGGIVADAGKRLAGNDLRGVTFTHDENDGGTGETVSREELKVVLREILRKIDPNDHEYARAAFGSLTEAGVITAGNLEQVRALLLVIAERAGEDAWAAYNALGAIAEAVKKKELSPVVLDLNLLRAIAEGAGEHAWRAYEALHGLAMSVKEKELNPVVLDLNLLLAIANRAGESAWESYFALGAIAEAVKKKELSPVVMDLELL